MDFLEDGVTTTMDSADGGPKVAGSFDTNSADGGPKVIGSTDANSAGAAQGGMMSNADMSAGKTIWSGTKSNVCGHVLAFSFLVLLGFGCGALVMAGGRRSSPPPALDAAGVPPTPAGPMSLASSGKGDPNKYCIANREDNILLHIA
jgi:hypothetical protein